MADAILRAHPLEIYKACDELFGESPWLSWEPETLLMELKSEVSDRAVDKLLAVQAVCGNTKVALTNSDAYENVINAFCNNVCVMDVIQPPEVEEMSYGHSQITLLAKEVHGADCRIEPSGEVPGYVAATAKFRGWILLPENLSFAQEMLDSLTCLTKNSPLYRENREIVDTVRAFIKRTSRADARAILNDPQISALAKNDTASLALKRVIGALLYDPTIIETGADEGSKA